MKIGIIRETKGCGDNRVVIVPNDAANIMTNSMVCGEPIEVVSQSSHSRCYSDGEYLDAGIKVQNDVDDCDLLVGVKEVAPRSLIEGKTYMFFGHVAKMQEYNKNLMKEMMRKRITFIDYEYLQKNGKRVIAFGWFAGLVGAYHTMRLYGKKTGKFNLPPTSAFKTSYDMVSEVRKMYPALSGSGMDILLTGTGRVADGARTILIAAGVRFTQAGTADLVRSEDWKGYLREDFRANPQKYVSKFQDTIKGHNVLISAHSWQPNQPLYLTPDVATQEDFPIEVVGDITCDIKGSIGSTIRPSTHDNPYYCVKVGSDGFEEVKDGGISVMAVDNLPNALPREASRYFSSILTDILSGNDVGLVGNATILKNGELTARYAYLKDWVNS